MPDRLLMLLGLAPPELPEFVHAQAMRDAHRCGLRLSYSIGCLHRWSVEVWRTGEGNPEEIAGEMWAAAIIKIQRRVGETIHPNPLEETPS